MEFVPNGLLCGPERLEDGDPTVCYEGCQQLAQCRRHTLGKGGTKLENGKTEGERQEEGRREEGRREGGRREEGRREEGRREEGGGRREGGLG